MTKLRALLIIQIFVFASVSGAKIEIPMESQFLGWKFSSSYQAEGKDLKNIKKIKISCGANLILPAHPQQDTKQYHLAVYGYYGKGLMKGGPNGKFGEICQTWSLATKDKDKTCLRSETLNLIVMSDVYRDQCGRLYRGYFRKMYFSSDESMGTLVSPGKTFYQKPKQEFEGIVETYVGETYPVKVSDFLYFTELFPGDIVKVQQGLERASGAGQFLDPESGLFNPPTNL